MANRPPGFKRIMLKLSGEALMGEKDFGIDPSILKQVAQDIHDIHKEGMEVAIVIGGGNIFRGLNCKDFGIGRVSADHMGMLATIINSLALGEILNNIGSETRIMSAIDINRIAEPYIRGRAISHLKKKRIVLFGAGTGNPYFSTDTAAALRAMEVKAEVLLKATKVDGVFDSDPEKNISAKPFEHLTHMEVLKKNLQVMDITAVSLAMRQRLPIIVFNLLKSGNINRVVSGEKVGTLIAGEEI